MWGRLGGTAHSVCPCALAARRAFGLGRGINRPEPSNTVQRPSPVPVCGEAAPSPAKSQVQRLQMRPIMRAIALIILVGAGLDGREGCGLSSGDRHSIGSC